MALGRQRHRGYAFVNLPAGEGGAASAADALRVIAALDGAELPLTDAGASEEADRNLALNVCPATTPVCKHFARDGVCRFGDRCLFRHVAR